MTEEWQLIRVAVWSPVNHPAASGTQRSDNAHRGNG